MKKINKKEILILIVLITILIMQIRAFNNSRADKLVDVVATIIDFDGLLSEENITLTALNEAESGISIMLPDIINTKKVNKYIVTKKEIVDNEEQTSTETKIEMIPGEKVYLTQEEQENLQINLNVKYDTLEVNSQTLYNKKLILEQNNEEVLTASGYMLYDTNMKVAEAEIESILEKITQTYPNKTLCGNYDIKLFSNESEYLAKEYSQMITIEIATNNNTSQYTVIEKQEDEIKELENILVENGKIKFKVEEIKTYLILENAGLLNEEATEVIAIVDDSLKLEIDDYESDKNYYIGLNYTENESKINSGKYSDTNLKEVQINYYGYNYGLSTEQEIATGTISDTEKQILISYRKCIPVDSSGNITITLIDNPFMNRPDYKGFNGWKTNNSKYSNSIITNSRTYEQTLTTNINNILNNSGEYVIDLYSDWIDANVIFVSSNGSSSNSGTSIDNPIDNNWTSINSKINANKKTCTNASSREANIIVLLNGTLNVNGLTGPSTPFTLTSLYSGVNYGGTSTYLNVDSTDLILDSDLQLDYLYVYSNKSYSSPSYSDTTDGTENVTGCIYGNMYNLRIGRGIIPTNSNYCTFSQVQGGYYNRSSSEYKLVIESGLYYTAQLYRAGSSTTNTTANAVLIVGNDIDRKKNNNESLKIYNRMASKTTSATSSPYNNGITVNMIVKSGTIGVDYFNSEDTDDRSDRNYAGIYVGGHGNTGYDKSDRYLLVEGGNIANLIGGLNISQSDMYKTYIYVKGGNIINITGGAGYTHTYGDRIIQVTGGCIKYSISGGSNGVAASSSTNNGQLTGESLIYVGGDAHIGATYTFDQNGNKLITETGSNNILYGVEAGSVCGGANGNNNYAGQTDGSYIIIDGNAVVHNNVFGGGNYGIIGATDTVIESPIIKFIDKTNNFETNTEYYIATSLEGKNGLTVNGNSLENETMSESRLPSDSAKWIFEAAGTQYYIKNSMTGQYIYVSNTSGYFGYYTSTVTMSATDKTAFTVQGTDTKKISYQYTRRGQTYTLYLNYDSGWKFSTSYDINQLYLLNYELLPEDTPQQDGKTLVNIKINGGIIKNCVYGGANRNSIYGTIKIDMTAGKVDGTIYGGSNIKGTIEGSSLVNISGGQIGNATSEDTVFGGGLGTDTDVKGRVLLNINEKGSNTTIYGNVYGGSSQGKISNNIEINIQDIPSTANVLSIQGSIFGGGKGTGTSPADVLSNITVNVDGSNLNSCNVFGGSNLAGTISGKITINVGKTYKSTLKTVYGGGNQASIGTETQRSICIFIR